MGMGKSSKKKGEFLKREKVGKIETKRTLLFLPFCQDKTLK
jgi:hypothetical protein